MKDLNTVYDLGPSRSMEGINDTAKLCDMLEIDLRIQTAWEDYMNEWGEACQNPKPIVSLWEISILDVNNKPCALCFDIINGDSVLVAG